MVAGIEQEEDGIMDGAGGNGTGHSPDGLNIFGWQMGEAGEGLFKLNIHNGGHLIVDGFNSVGNI